MVLVYNGLVLSFGGMVYEAVAIVSAVIGILRFNKAMNGDNSLTA